MAVKSKRMLGFIKIKIISDFDDPRVICLLYCSLVRFILEYLLLCEIHIIVMLLWIDWNAT